MPKTLDEIVEVMADGAMKAGEWSDFWSPDDAEALMRAALAALEEAGWVVVPVKPDADKMHAAFDRAMMASREIAYEGPEVEELWAHLVAAERCAVS